MDRMTGVERMSRILRRKPVDRIGVFEHFWSDTQKKWTADGCIDEGENLADHFDFDMQQCSPFNMVADVDFEPQTLEETEDTRLELDGNGARLRWHKKHNSTPEHLGFKVEQRTDWEEYIKPLLKPEKRRINFEAYRQARNHAALKGRFFAWTGMHVFEIMKNVTGHVNMLTGMALDPDWVRDMVNTYSQLYIDMLEILFSEEGRPDGIWFYEDMGFKGRPFMSPVMYDEIVKAGHRATFEFAHAQDLPVILHSCGFVEPLVPGLLDAGIDCLQVIEVKAGMDLLELYKNYGDVLSFMGGIDVRTLYTNDRAIIDAELEKKIPTVKNKFGFVLHSDHSIPNTVDYDTYCYFIKQGLELGTYRHA